MRKILKVMLTEDGGETLHELAGILRSNNCEVSTVFKNGTQVIERLKSEISELENAISTGSDIKIEEELGDILFSCTNLSRFLKKDSEKALTFAINKFIIRFSGVDTLIREDGMVFSELSQEELNEYWEKVKSNSV